MSDGATATSSSQGGGSGLRFRLPDRLHYGFYFGARRAARAPSPRSRLRAGPRRGYAAGDRRGAAARPGSGTRRRTRGGVRRGGGAARRRWRSYPPLMQDTGACSVQRHAPRARRAVHQPVHGAAHPHVGQGRAAASAVHPGTWQWTPCGALPQEPAQVYAILLPGASTWLMMTFSVKHGCPAALPVQFTITAARRRPFRHRAPARLPDPGQVPTPGARGHQRPPSAASFATATPAPDRGSNASR